MVNIGCRSGASASVASSASTWPYAGANLKPLPDMPVATTIRPAPTVSMIGMWSRVTESWWIDPRTGSGTRSGIIRWACSPAQRSRSEAADLASVAGNLEFLGRLSADHGVRLLVEVLHHRRRWIRSAERANRLLDLVVKAPRATHGQDEESSQPWRWTKGQLLTFRAYVDDLPLGTEPWAKAGMRLALCGLRRSEVLGLDWSNVNRKTGEVYIVASRTKDGLGSGSTINGPKTKKSKRTVAAETVHPGTLAALRELWLAQGRPAAGLVISDTNGARVDPDTFSRKFTSLCAAAEVPYIGSIHNTRHTLATIFKEAGMPDHHAAAFFGHDAETTGASTSSRTTKARFRPRRSEGSSSPSERAFVSGSCEQHAAAATCSKSFRLVGAMRYREGWGSCRFDVDMPGSSPRSAGRCGPLLHEGVDTLIT